jgi:hypothetical protein
MASESVLHTDIYRLSTGLSWLSLAVILTIIDGVSLSTSPV